MNIAVDYDETWTADPETFAKIVTLFQQQGHSVAIVTLRDQTTRSCVEIRGSLMKHLPRMHGEVPIIFSNGHWKTEATKAAEFPVDVWIDDSPQLIGPPFTLRDMRAYWEEHDFDPRKGFGGYGKGKKEEA